MACQTALDTIKHVITNSPVLIYPNPSREYHLFTDASKHTWSGVLTQQRSNSEINGDKEHTYHQITYQTSTFWLHNLNSQQLWRNAMQLWCCFKNGILPTRHRSHLKVWSWPSWKLIKNQTKNTLTQNWTLEIFSITPYIMFKHIKGKEDILADSLTQLQRSGLYERCPQKEDDWDCDTVLMNITVPQVHWGKTRHLGWA